MIALKPATQSLLVALLPLLLWMGVIFFFSSLPGSGADFEPPLWYVLERKSAHVFEYAVLMLLMFRFVRRAFPRDVFLGWLSLSMVCSLAYAATDELHQFFVFGRGAKMTDVAIDGIGIIFMVVGLLVFRKWNGKKG